MVEPVTIGTLPEHVQPVADLQFLQLAQESVELAQCCRRFVVWRDAAIAIEAGGARLLQDCCGERSDAARIALCRFVIFIDQMFEFSR